MRCFRQYLHRDANEDCFDNINLWLPLFFTFFCARRSPFWASHCGQLVVTYICTRFSINKSSSTWSKCALRGCCVCFAVKFVRKLVSKRRLHSLRGFEHWREMADRVKFTMDYYLRNKLDDEMEEDILIPPSVFNAEKQVFKVYDGEKYIDAGCTSPNHNPSFSPPVKPPRRKLSNGGNIAVGPLIEEGIRYSRAHQARTGSFSSADEFASLSRSGSEVERCSSILSSVVPSGKENQRQYQCSSRGSKKKHATYSVSVSTQTPSRWSSIENLRALTELNRNASDAVSCEEQLACRLFMTRRCWSFMSKRGERYGGKRVCPQPIGKNNSDCGLNFSTIMKEMKLIQKQNLALQEQIKHLNEKLLSVSNASSNSDVATLIANISKAEQERKELMDKRVRCLEEERDMAVKQVNEMIDILLQPNAVLDRRDSDSESPERNEVVYEVSSAVNDVKREDVEKMERRKLEQLRINLEYETRLRLSSERKLNRVMKIINALQEKVAVYHSSSDW